MRATEDTLKNISLFEDRLVKAFRKMILGICVELSDEGKDEYAKANLSEGQWYFIKSINDDESITLVSQNHHVFSNLKLSHIKI